MGTYRDKVGWELMRAVRSLPPRVVMDDGHIRSRDRIETVLHKLVLVANRDGWLKGQLGNPYNTRQLSRMLGVDHMTIEASMRFAVQHGWMLIEQNHGRYAARRRWLLPKPLEASVVEELRKALLAESQTRLTDRRSKISDSPSTSPVNTQIDGLPIELNAAPPSTSRSGGEHHVAMQPLGGNSNQDVTPGVTAPKDANATLPDDSGKGAEDSAPRSVTEQAAQQTKPSTDIDSQQPSQKPTSNEELLAVKSEDWNGLQATPEGKEAWAAIANASPPDLRTQLKNYSLFPYRAGNLLLFTAWYPRTWDEVRKYRVELDALIRKHLPDITRWFVAWDGWAYELVAPTLEPIHITRDPEVVTP